MLRRAKPALYFRMGLMVGGCLSSVRGDPVISADSTVDAKTPVPAERPISEWRQSLQAEFKYIPRPTIDVGVRLRAPAKKPVKSNLDLPPSFLVQEKISDLQSLDDPLDYNVVDTGSSDEESTDISPSTANSNAVLLPAFVVRDLRFNYGELKLTLKNQEMNARIDAIQAKLGNQLHVYPLTRHFAVGYMTVFHIPVLAGFGWSW